MDLLQTAKTLSDCVEAQADKAGIPVAVTVVDSHGNLVLQHRMNGAPLFALEISERKAYTSALVKMSTADLLRWSNRDSRFTLCRRSAAVASARWGAVSRCANRAGSLPASE